MEENLFANSTEAETLTHEPQFLKKKTYCHKKHGTCHLQLAVVRNTCPQSSRSVVSGFTFQNPEALVPKP